MSSQEITGLFIVLRGTLWLDVVAMADDSSWIEFTERPVPTHESADLDCPFCKGHYRDCLNAEKHWTEHTMPPCRQFIDLSPEDYAVAVQRTLS